MMNNFDEFTLDYVKIQMLRKSGQTIKNKSEDMNWTLVSDI